MPITMIPSHRVARWLLVNIRDLLDMLGLRKDHVTESIIYVVVISLLAVGCAWCVRRAVLFIARRIVKVRKTQMGERLLRDHVLTKCSHVITPLVILALLPFAFTTDSMMHTVCQRAILVYTILAFTVALCSLARFTFQHYNATRNTKGLPLDGILYTVRGILWGIAVICCIGVIVDKSPAYLLTGLGAFAAALMLIFKDSLLGFVATLQLAQNDMVRVGDWIVVPDTPADGYVLDVSLTRVKIQNWDYTIITLPPYRLVQGSMQNYRGMLEIGVRRVTATITFDFQSVSPLTPPQVDQIVAKLPQLQKYVAEQRKPGTPGYQPGVDVVNGSLDTNIGLWRAYMCQYILGSDYFSHDYQLLVHTTDASTEGLSVQLYCFTATNNWTAYDAISSILIEHAVAVAPLFGLRVYNAPSGHDVQTLHTRQVALHGSEVKAQDGEPQAKG